MYSHKLQLLRFLELTLSCCYAELEMSKSKQGNTRAEITNYSDWMSQLPPELHNIPLFRLAIPGTRRK